MKQYKMVTRPAYQEEELEFIQCELCEQITRHSSCWNDYDSFHQDEVTIQWKEGNNYPDGGSGTRIEVDLCPTCFQEKLTPWIQSQGGQPRMKEWDW